MTTREANMSERDPNDVLAATRRFFADGEQEAWEQTNTPHAMTDEQLRLRRRCDNVDRLSSVSGAEYTVALNTCAVLAVERDEACAEVDRLKGELGRMWLVIEEACINYHGIQFTLYKDGKEYAVPPDTVRGMVKYVNEECKKLQDDGWSLMKSLYKAWSERDEAHAEVDRLRAELAERAEKGSDA